ncbi:DUF2460 domain-containing protein [Wolbachia endosymbiont of Chironomus riparius]|uniref:DUF2460 domain-containing protein n=1 Tax=Wolbachia endosymbiont of Chironomus riparius TaxID=2883238 RepID=UPI00209F3310|nr:DUF2460 domain-containing protein [Wolbachia endosymbiont of Chironomus riparius]
MSFTEVRFPENISYGSTGGPEFSTEIVKTHNGYEQRNINWSNARARYNISYGVKSNEQLLELITFFRARKGRAIGFRLKDWLDFTTIDQEIGTGNGKQTTFQLIKIYVNSQDKYIRTIKKPVYDTVKIYLNSKEYSEYSVDYSNGKIMFMNPPKKDTIITANFEFDVPVRFDTDYLSTSIDNYGSNSCNNISLVEIKL